MLVVAALGLASAPTSAAWTPRVWLHLHNCYPDEGRGADHPARALAATRGTVAIGQGDAWVAGRRPQAADGDDPPEVRMAKAVGAAPDQIIPSGATNDGRWANHAWAVVETGWRAGCKFGTLDAVGPRWPAAIAR